jgi:hypothetical protein
VNDWTFSMSVPQKLFRLRIVVPTESLGFRCVPGLREIVKIRWHLWIILNLADDVIEEENEECSSEDMSLRSRVPIEWLRFMVGAFGRRGCWCGALGEVVVSERLRLSVCYSAERVNRWRIVRLRRSMKQLWIGFEFNGVAEDLGAFSSSGWIHLGA